MINKSFIFAMMGTIATMGCCHPAFAENLPGAFGITISEAYYHFDDKRDMKNNISMPNISLAYNVDAHWALEAGIGVLNAEYSHHASDDPGAHVHGMLYTVDGVYRFMPDSWIEPYAIGGMGVLGLKPSGNDPVQQGNFNLGVGAQLFMAPWVALRLEARDILMTTGSGMNDFMINAGLSFVWGGNRPVYKDEVKLSKLNNM